MSLIQRKTVLDGLYQVNKYLSYTPLISALVAFFDQIVLKPIFERCNINKNEHKFFRLILEKDKWDNGKLLVPIWNIFEARVLFQKKKLQIISLLQKKKPPSTKSKIFRVQTIKIMV